MSFFDNTRKPVGFGGKIMVSLMNIGHRALTVWGMTFLELPDNARVLDCGCGGGANIRELPKKCPQGEVRGIDYSTVSVEKARRHNAAAIREGSCEVRRAAWSELNSRMAALARSRPLKLCISGLIRFPVSGRCTVS